MKFTKLPPPKTAAGRKVLKEYAEAVKRGEKTLAECRKNKEKKASCSESENL